jgi:hypothetical protein
MKHIFKIIIIAGVALAVSLGLWMYLNGFLTKSKASNGVALLAFAEGSTQANGGQKVHADLTVTTVSGISGIDVTFTTVGTNLSFSYTDTIAHLPVGFELLLDEPMMTTTTGNNKNLVRIVLVSKKPAAQLPKSAIIPLYFTVVTTGQASQTVLTANMSASQVVGVSESQSSGTVFSLEGNMPISYTVRVNDPRAASAANLICDDERNASRANCGVRVAIKWNDSANEDGYKVYKNNQLVKTIGQNATSYNDVCNNFNPATYSVIAYNASGSVSTTLPTVSCACKICPTSPPPTPTPMMPTSSSDLIFHVVFPDAAQSVSRIPDVKITVFDNDGKRICNDDTDCAQVVTFERVPDAKINNTFRSPQLQYQLQKNQAYSIVVKQNHAVRQTYKHVFLKWQKVLQCLEGTTDSGCGDLIEEVANRPLYSGDLDGSNKIDQTDADKLSIGLGSQSAEGDLNFDGKTDQEDVDILGKNFNRNGT